MTLEVGREWKVTIANKVNYTYIISITNIYSLLAGKKMDGLC